MNKLLILFFFRPESTPLNEHRVILHHISKQGINPENYRGIAITSNIGTRLNMVLNARLDTFLEDNMIINKA